MTREQMKDEAVARMKKLNLSENVIRDFVEDDLLNESENGGALYWLDDREKQYVKDFEEESGCLVYHVIHSFVDICGETAEMYSMLYVSPYEEEWEMDFEDIDEGIVMANVYNVTHGFSDMGSIHVRQRIGGLVE